MASGRFLSTSIAEDDRLSKLSLMAEFIYLKTIPHLDRDGMITGRPGLLYSRVCPAREELFGGLLALIDEWVAVGLVVRFDGPEGPVLFFPGFLKNNSLPHYNRERASKFPAPPGYIRTDKGLAPVAVNDPGLNSVQDEVQESVQDIDLQEQEQQEDQDKEQDQQQQKDEDDTHARDPIHAAWFDTYSEELPDNLERLVTKLLNETSEAAVIYGIRESVGADKRTFGFIAKCARNYIPPAPQNNNYTNGYHLEAEIMPGVTVLTPTANGKPPPLPRPMPTDDPWSILLAELLPTLPGQAAQWLEGSELDANGELAGVPLCRVIVNNPKANAEWLQRQTEPAIRKRLGSLLGKRVTVHFDIVAATEQEPA